MKNKKLLFIGLSLLLILFISGCSKKYEYVVASYDDSVLEESLNKMAERGCTFDSTRRVTEIVEGDPMYEAFMGQETKEKSEIIFRCPKGTKVDLYLTPIN